MLLVTIGFAEKSREKALGVASSNGKLIVGI